MKLDTRLVQAEAGFAIGGRGEGQSDVRRTLEGVLATIEGGGRSYAFSSGQMAVHAFAQTLPAGSRILATEDLNPEVWNLLGELQASRGIRVESVDTSDLEAVRKAFEFSQDVKAVYVENPSQVLVRGADLRALAWETHRHNALLVVDNTSLTPVQQRPLDYGADVVLHVGARNLAGVREVQAGFAVTRLTGLIDKLDRLQKTTAAQLSPFDAWQVLQGLKTLGLRSRRQQESAVRIAQWLSTHPRVRQVFHPSLDGHAGGESLRQQSRGFGAVISFEIVEPGLVPGFLRALRLWRASGEQAGVESLVSVPAAHPQGEWLANLRQRLGVDDGLIRLSVGIEDAQDLVDDLDRALNNPATGFAEVWDYVI
jgi:cystathionine beta-lyase/cystathionine gamma-synthase